LARAVGRNKTVVRVLGVLAAVVLVFAFAGCGSGDSKGGGLADAAQEANQQESDRVSSVEQARTTLDSALERCVPVPEGLLAHLTAKLNIEGPGTLKDAQAVESRDKDVHYVAAEIHGEGIEGDNVIGTWAVNDFEAGTGVYAFDEVARKYSDWPDASEAAPSLQADDDGAAAAQGCVRAQRP
jgi:hypothetical protein